MLLTTAEGGVGYPYWGDAFGWHTSGKRVDVVGGRRATTVFYSKSGWRVGYTIVAGRALSVPHSAAIWRGGTIFHVLALDGRPVVTWLRHGHTCILASQDVPTAELMKLASWRDGRSVSQ
jgi:hypothetical protein